MDSRSRMGMALQVVVHNEEIVGFVINEIFHLTI